MLRKGAYGSCSSILLGGWQSHPPAVVIHGWGLVQRHAGNRFACRHAAFFAWAPIGFAKREGGNSGGPGGPGSSESLTGKEDRDEENREGFERCR
jgi:hypothetical protein